MKNVSSFFLAIAIVGLVVSCYNDNLSELDPSSGVSGGSCDTTGLITYADHIAPLLKTNCGTSNSCHGSKNTSGYNLSTYSGVRATVASGKLISSITVSSLINTKTDSIFVRMKNTGFAFKNALMENHFNENYMESTKYPIDTFRGKINETVNYSKEDAYSVTASGMLLIHGLQKAETIKGILTIKGGVIHLQSEFFVHAADFKIEVPKLVFEKIAEEIKVTMAADYKLKK